MRFKLSIAGVMTSAYRLVARPSEKEAGHWHLGQPVAQWSIPRVTVTDSASRAGEKRRAQELFAQAPRVLLETSPDGKHGNPK
jgi:hypothetical protein